jgi:Pyridoxamine 5'-phosphate oxidase
MPSWSEVEAEVPELAALARRLFDAHTHKTIATLRRDGSPRISGIEIEFSDGELWMGSMWHGVKALDLQRDPRFALHSGSGEPADWPGDAKLAGSAVEATDPEKVGNSHRFRADITELSVVRLGEPRDHLVIESWHPGRGYERRTRK